MSIQVKRRREAASFLSTFIGAQGELIVDTTNNRVQVHDGATAGGWPAAKLSEVIVNTRTAISDANYTALATDRTIAFTAITAARIVTLPASSSFPTGTRLAIFDESGACSATNTITVARAGSDTIDGAVSALISSAYGYLALQSNGAGKWTIVDQSTTSLPAVSIGTPFDPNNVLSVYGQSALFSSAGNFNVTLNKGGSGGNTADTASLIFEDGFAGRAQIGLCGDDNFHFKVSPNGSTWYDALDIDASNGYVGIGTGSPTAPLTVSGPAQILLQLYCGGNGTPPAVFDLYSGSGSTALGTAFLRFRAARGTSSSPSAVQLGDRIGGFGAMGYGATGFATANRANINFNAAENWTDTAQGTYFYFTTTTPGTTTGITSLSVYQGVVVGAGTTDPGAGNLTVGGALQVGAPTGGVLSAGTINVAGGIYLNNTAYTNPDFVFEKYFTGQVAKYADKPRAKDYRGLMALDALAAHIRESHRLPGIDDRPTDIFERGDIALEKIEEHTLYILQLHRRVAELERRR